MGKRGNCDQREPRDPPVSICALFARLRLFSLCVRCIEERYEKERGLDGDPMSYGPHHGVLRSRLSQEHWCLETKYCLVSGSILLGFFVGVVLGAEATEA